MMDTPVGGDAWVALAWCLAFAALGATGAALLFRRRAT